MPYPPPPRAPTYDYDRGGGQTMLDLIMRQGQIQAEGARASGGIWGNALGQIGQTLAGGLQQRAAQKKEEEEKAILNAQDTAFMRRISDTSLPTITPAETLSIYGPHRGPAIHQGFASLRSEKPDLKIVLAGFRAATPQMRAAGWPEARQHLEAAGFPQEQLPKEYDDGWFNRFDASVSGGRPRAALTEVSPNATLFNEETNQPVFTAPGAPRTENRPAVGSFEDYLVRTAGPNPTAEQTIAARRVYEQADNPPRAPREDNEPLMAVIDPTTGRPVYRRRREAEGLAPASTREQGRPVTSGDANTIADLKTSLDDLKEIRHVLSGSGATGTAAAVGAALPNWATELTGVGMEAKKKQAALDRVKQVIGKALEEGVLRKEDEKKYEKILATISDPDEVVISKLDGLEQAIVLRLQRQLESLADAGYDTARFEGRGQGRVPPVPEAGSATPAGGGAPPVPIVQRNTATGAVRHSLDGGRTWKSGQP